MRWWCCCNTYVIRRLSSFTSSWDAYTWLVYVCFRVAAADFASCLGRMDQKYLSLSSSSLFHFSQRLIYFSPLDSSLLRGSSTHQGESTRNLYIFPPQQIHLRCIHEIITLCLRKPVWLKKVAFIYTGREYGAFIGGSRVRRVSGWPDCCILSLK